MSRWISSARSSDPAAWRSRTTASSAGNEVGVGSTFRVLLPRGRVAGMDAQVLLVDDDDDARETLEMLLSSHGYTVATAENGQLALDRVHLGAEDEPLAVAHAGDGRQRLAADLRPDAQEQQREQRDDGLGAAPSHPAPSHRPIVID